MQGMHRKVDHETSIAAARKVRPAKLRQMVLDHAQERGWPGFIDDDLKERWPGKPESSIRKRRTELSQENWLLETGETRENRHGQQEKVWVHREYRPASPPLVARFTAQRPSRADLEAAVAELLGALRPFTGGPMPTMDDLARAERAYRKYQPKEG